MAAADYHLKIDGIEGESKSDGHTKEIDISSFSWGATQPGTFASGGGGGAGKASFQDFHFTTQINKASPKIMLACATGQHIKEAILTASKAGDGQQNYMTVKLSDVIVSSYQTGGSGSSDILPMDQFSLNYAKIEYEYKEQGATGTTGGAIKSGYDIKASKKV